MKVKKNKIVKNYECDIWGIVSSKGKVNRFFYNIKDLLMLRKKRKKRKRKIMILSLEKEKPFKTKRRNLFSRKLFMKKRLFLYYGGYTHSCYKKDYKKLKRNSFKNISELLLLKLEMRFDSVLNRLNLGSNIFEVRDYIKKGYFLINKRVVRNYRYILNVGDIIEVIEYNKNGVYEGLKKRLESNKVLFIFNKHLYMSYDILVGVVIYDPLFISYMFEFEKNFFNTYYNSRF